MAIAVFAIHILVVIDEIFIPGIVGRIDINHIYAPRVGIRKRCEGLKVVALYQDMVGGLGRRANDWLLNLCNHGQLSLQFLLHMLGLILPNEAILFVCAEQPYKLRLFLVGYSDEGLYLFGKFPIVHWLGSCSADSQADCYLL